VKILWKPTTKNLDSYVIADEKVTMPEVPESMIKNLKTLISHYLGNEFTEGTLDDLYGMLDHSGDTCQYNPLKIQMTDAYVHETYGLIDEMM